MKQIVGTINNRLFINGEFVKWPNKSSNRYISQSNGKVFVNGFEWTGADWKRTIQAMWHYLLCLISWHC